MTGVVVVLLALFASTLVNAAESTRSGQTTPPSDQLTAAVSPIVQRTTLTVSDPEASLGFYRDLLGFVVSGDVEYDTPALRTMFNIPETSVPRLILLDGRDQPRALGLVSAPGLEVDKAVMAQSGPALVLTVTQMDLLHDRLQAAGVTVVQKPQVLLGFNGKPIGREAMYLDPDGIRVVLFELKSD